MDSEIGIRAIPLAQAYFCLDEEVIVALNTAPTSGDKRCPLCGGESLAPLAQWLNRPPVRPWHHRPRH